MQEIYTHSMARTSFTLAMLAVAGGLALALGVVGIYGVISYAVSTRRREIGVRLALGAQRRALLALFVRSGLLMAGLGVPLGLAVSAAVTRLMSSLLFGVNPLDPTTFLVMSAVLLGTAAVASYLPARRAAGVDPVEALKVD